MLPLGFKKFYKACSHKRHQNSDLSFYSLVKQQRSCKTIVQNLVITLLISVLLLYIHTEAYSNTWQSFIWAHPLSVEDFRTHLTALSSPKWANHNIWSVMERKALRTRRKAEQTAIQTYTYEHMNTDTPEATKKKAKLCLIELIYSSQSQKRDFF